MKLLAAINGKLYALEEIDPNDVLDGCYEDCDGCDCPEVDPDEWCDFVRDTLDEVADETALGGLGKCLPDCNDDDIPGVGDVKPQEVDRAWAIGSQEHKREILNLIEKQREAWGKAFAASDEEAVLLQTKEDCSKMLEWCKPGMRIQVCPSDAAYYFAEVVEGPNDLTGSILVKNELTGRKHPVLATANVYAAPDPDDKAYGVNLRKQTDQESESPHAHTT